MLVKIKTKESYMEQETLKKYNMLIEELRDGKNLNALAKENKLDLQNMRDYIKKILKEDYTNLVYGEIIDFNNGFAIRKIPKRQTDRTESNITKIAKNILKKKYNCYEEVGVWMDNYGKRYTIDLYSVENKLGIELYWTKYSSTKIIKRLKIYKQLFGNVICALLKDSSNYSKNRNYYYLPKKIMEAGFEVIIVDIAQTPPST